MLRRESEEFKLLKQLCEEWDFEIHKWQGTDKDGNHVVHIRCPNNAPNRLESPEPFIDRMLEANLPIVKWEKVRPDLGWDYQYTTVGGETVRTKRGTANFYVNNVTGRLVDRFDRNREHRKPAPKGFPVWRQLGVLWQLKIHIADTRDRNLEMAPPEILKQMEYELDSDDWRENRSVRKVCENRRYTFGQRVYLASRTIASAPPKYTYYFMTSYRTRARMGAFLLWRVDDKGNGRCVSHANAMSDTPKGE